jgi:hypothetical protein
MSSIIEGNNYDIFISYRQKDKHFYDQYLFEYTDDLKKMINLVL